jgi:E3 ubiquitin-protein ligase NRDP1
MGTDPDLFVHPERISRELICPICTQVLENPVQTADEHLFCEDELLEWMSRSNEPTCPVTGNKLDPDGIRKPSRIVMNMLGELERYCDNRSEGCEWTGENEHLRNHTKGCTFRRREDMVNEIRRKDEKIETLRAKVEALTKQVKKEKARGADLANELLMCHRKLKVYVFCSMFFLLFLFMMASFVSLIHLLLPCCIL